MITFIILSWNSERYLLRCFASIEEKCDAEDIDYEIIVIDNGSKDNTLNILHTFKRKRLDNFHFVSLESNRGTTYSRNIGLKMAKGSIICVLDSDTEFGEGSLTDTFCCLNKDNNIGIIAPCLVLPDGKVQNSVKKFPTFLHKAIKIPKVIFGAKSIDIDFYKDFPFKVKTNVDMAISACWFFRKELLNIVGLLDEKIFYAPEDLDFCMRIKKAEKQIIYYPFLKVLHHTQQITHKKPFSKTSWSHFFGLIYYYRKHGGWFSIFSTIFLVMF